MLVHADELECARARARTRDFEALSDDQLRRIVARGRELHRWFKTHPRTHALIGVAVIAAIFAADWWVLRRLPLLLLLDGGGAAALAVAGAALLAGAAHAWIGYSLTVYSVHEGAAHDLIFPGQDRLSRAASWLARNLCRASNAEPDHYAEAHMGHHARFGTEHDPEFLNFVKPRRFWRILLPYGVVLNYSDFVIHRPLTYTRGRVISAGVAVLYHGTYAYLSYRSFGLLFTIIAFVIVLPHVGFWTDRCRQFTEHNLMPLDNRNGARNFGLGMWGLFIGGGPWGQPCHFAHHLVPSIPWYQQLMLHRFISSLLTDRQRSQFMVRPVTGYPRLFAWLLRELGEASGRQR